MTDETPHDAAQAELDREQSTHARELLRIAAFGMDVAAFVGGKIGQRMVADSEAERAQLLEDLLLLDPDDEAQRPAMRKVRQRIAVLDHWQELFAGYITAGRDAETQYQELEGGA